MENSFSLPSSCSHSQHSPSDNASAHVTTAHEHVTDASSSAGGGGGGSSNGAKYKLMSPAKLPISRSTSITIPPGLSPTSFLESPVLLSNIKAEPSPTTGSFFKLPVMQGSGETVALSFDKKCSRGKTVDEGAASSFEFKFYTGSNFASGLSSLAFPAGLNRNGPVSQIQDQQFSQSPVPSSLVTHEPPNSKEFRLPEAMSMHDSSVCSSVDELNKGRHSDSGIQKPFSDQKDSISSITADRTSDNGYNWRKYGQKLVKGSEFPRSYYKCTYPNCEVKKIFERSPSGQITEIFYKGSHDHPKPQASRRHNPAALVSIQEEIMDKDISFTGHDDMLKANSMEPNVSLVLSPQQANEEGFDGSGLLFQGINDDIDEEDPFYKRRKMEDDLDCAPVVKPIREPRVVVQTVSEVDILDDGYRWRKYGQKVVRCNPNPRSYYKCTNVGCPVRKHVERASHDPKAVINTYEGKHNHDVPIARNISHEFPGTAPYSGTSKIRPEESCSITLDLGVGISCVPENTTNEQVHSIDANTARIQITPNNSSMMAALQLPASYGIVNGGLKPYGNIDNGVEGHSFQAPLPRTNPSNQCPPNLGRILMGP